MSARAAYQNSAVLTASPQALVTLLFDRVIADIEATHAALSAAPQEQHLAGELLVHAQQIIAELQAGLDHARGGKVAANLEAIYVWCSEEMLATVLDNDGDRLTAVATSLRDLRASWVLATGHAF